MSKLMRNEDAFTGLEAAIVLIAFVVVAAVFSYVVLGAGFFTASESQRTVHTGVAQATSNLEISGPVIVKATSTKALGSVSFFLQLAAGGASVDMTKVTFTVSTAEELETFTYSKTGDASETEVGWEWYVDGAVQNDASKPPKNDMLDKFEMVKIKIIGLPDIAPNDRFTVEVKPDIGAALPINRMAPADFQPNHNYEVY
ncbi:Archaebacterial flagellin [anaerobic digester metagenome]